MTEIFSYVFPGMLVMFVFFITQTVMNDVFVEGDQKTLHRMLASLPTMQQILISKILRCICIGLIAELIMILFAYLVIGMSWGNPLYWFPTLFFLNLAMTGILAIIYGLCATRQQADGLSTAIILFSSILGGSMVPSEELPQFLRTVGSFTVNHYAIESLRATIFSQPADPVFRSWIIFLAVGLIGIPLGGYLIHKRMEMGKVA